MAVELRIQGPGLDTVLVIDGGQPEVVLGRDADCDVCLPDPQRNVSRRHLAVWNAGDELRFRVLSVINGVEMPFGLAPPGAQGVLPIGQAARLGDYSLLAGRVAPPAPGAEDPWAVFDREGSGIAPLPDAMSSRHGAGLPQAAATEEDPFGDWGFESTFGPGSKAGDVTVQASGTAAASDMSAFFAGLGLDPASQAQLSRGELETIGKVVRIAIEGLFRLHESRAALKKDLRADDRTMMAASDNNPLKSDWPVETRLRYLFGGRAASVGFGNPERALHALLAELLAHDAAMGAASRAAVEGTLCELSPPVLKSHLLGPGSKLFESARLWDAYSKHHAEQAQHMPVWVQRLLDRHFTQTYLREILRLQRETQTRSG